MIRVKLKSPASRRFIQAQWTDPVTGSIKTRSTGTRVRREAERFAAKLELELTAGTYKPPSNTTFAEAADRYEREFLASKRKKTRQKAMSTIRAIERLVNPKLLRALTASEISKFSAKLREEGLAEVTIHGHLACLRKFLNWCCGMDLMPVVPHLEFPEITPAMHGRPITEEEFDRFLLAIPKVERIPDQYRADWEHFARGIWLSSLRLEEAMTLHWTDDRYLCIDFSHRRPMMRIQAVSDKGKVFRLLPITPDFAEFLAQTPPAERRGYVFNPWTRPRGTRAQAPPRHRPTAEHAGKVLSEIGEKAGIKVNETKFASAHDFRRSFGFRWAKHVPAKVLQELMRHESIQTTNTYYVGDLAVEAADIVWQAAARSGNAFGNTGGKHSSTPTGVNAAKTDSDAT